MGYLRCTVSNIAHGVVTYLVARQTVREQQFVSEATRNQVLQRVALAHVDLLRAAGQKAVLLYNTAQFRLYVAIGFSPVQAMRGESSNPSRAEPQKDRASGRTG